MTALPIAESGPSLRKGRTLDSVMSSDGKQPVKAEIIEKQLTEQLTQEDPNHRTQNLSMRHGSSDSALPFVICSPVGREVHHGHQSKESSANRISSIDSESQRKESSDYSSNCE